MGVLLIATLCAGTCIGCRRNQPHDNARRQRTVVVYTALDRSFAEPILDEFSRRTGIETLAVYDTESTKSVGLANRILAERRRPRCDVFWNNEIVNTLLLRREGLLRPTHPAHAADYDEKWRDPNGYWYGFAARARVLLIHTEQMPPENAPRSMDDLLDARWHGRVGMAKPTAGTTATHVACLFARLGESAATDYFERLRANGLHIESGNKACAENVGSGRLSIAWTDTDDAIIEVDAGRPVRIVYPDGGSDGDGTLLIPNTLAAVAESPHPREAEALIDYLLSREVEAALATGPSAQIPLNRTCRVRSRALPTDAPPIRFMDVDFESATDHWPAAQRFVSRFLH